MGAERLECSFPSLNMITMAVRFDKGAMALLFPKHIKLLILCDILETFHKKLFVSLLVGHCITAEKEHYDAIAIQPRGRIG